MIVYDRFDNAETRKYLLSCFSEMFLDERWNKFVDVVSCRTRHLTVVLEDIFQNHNASALIRTCELTGILDLHFVENQNPYNINPDIVVGSDKWINIFRYNKQSHNTLECYTNLRKEGYKIYATCPNRVGYLPEELPVDEKIALVFGNEGAGLSSIALENADGYLKIPSFGFTESYNISVSLAICVYELLSRIRKNNQNWQLSEEEKEKLLIDYALKSLRNSDIILKQLLKNKTI
jgi:tRNA (guanosine-2'-O-)-methyltransferase